MEGHCSTGQSPKWAVVPMEEEEDEDEEKKNLFQQQVHQHLHTLTKLFLCIGDGLSNCFM